MPRAGKWGGGWGRGEQCLKPPVPIPPDLLHLREQLRVAVSAIEHRDPVPPLKGVLDDPATDELGAAKNEKVHAGSLLWSP